MGWAVETDFIREGVNLGVQITVKAAVANNPDNVARVGIGKCVNRRELSDAIERRGQRAVSIGSCCLVDENRPAFNVDTHNTGTQRNVPLAGQHHARGTHERGHGRTECEVDFGNQVVANTCLSRSPRHFDDAVIGDRRCGHEGEGVRDALTIDDRHALHARGGKRRTVAGDFQDPLQRLGLEPKVVNAARLAIEVAIEIRSRRIHNIVVDGGSEVESQFVFTIRAAPQTGVGDVGIVVVVAAGTDANEICARSKVEFDERIFAEIVVVLSNQLGGPIGLQLIKTKLGVQGARIRQSLGKCLSSEHPSVRHIELEEIDVLAGCAKDKLPVNNVVVTRVVWFLGLAEVQKRTGRAAHDRAGRQFRGVL